MDFSFGRSALHRALVKGQRGWLNKLHLRMSAFGCKANIPQAPCGDCRRKRPPARRAWGRRENQDRGCCRHGRSLVRLIPEAGRLLGAIQGCLRCLHSSLSFFSIPAPQGADEDLMGVTLPFCGQGSGSDRRIKSAKERIKISVVKPFTDPEGEFVFWCIARSRRTYC